MASESTAQLQADLRDETVTLLPGPTAFEAAHSVIDQRLLAEDVDIIRREREPTSCTAAFVPFLGWERSVHHWTPGGTADAEATNRARIASSFDDHAGYGAPSALEAEMRLDLAWAGIDIREYWEVRGFHWPDFQVVVRVLSDGPRPPAYADVRASAIARKNTRDWPGGFSYEVRESGPFGIAAKPVLNGTIHLLPLDPTPQEVSGLFYGAAASLTGTINLRPL